MRFLDEYVIGDNIWFVKRVRVIRSLKGTKRETFGLSDPSSHEIKIKIMSDRDELETFIHEVFECMREEYGIKMPHWLINKLQGPIAQFLIDNFLGPI